MVQISTARGDTIDSSDAGFTLMVETILGPTWAEIENNWPDVTISRWPQERLAEMAAEKLETAYEHGIRTICDRAIPGDTARNVRRLKKVAERTRVNIVIGTGWYTWHYLPFFFAAAEEDTWIKETSSMAEHEVHFMELQKQLAKDHEWPTLAQLMLRDIEVGVIDTGVRASFIKFAVDAPGLTPDVTKVIRTSARVHRQTGVFISTHTGMGVGVPHGALQQLVLEQEGVDLSRVLLGHLDYTPADVPIDEFLKLADKGSKLGFDTVHLDYLWPKDWRLKRVERILELCKRGYIEQIIISNDDSCFHDVAPVPQPDLPTYTEVTLKLIPELLEAGLTKRQIDQITIDNPRRMFESNGLGGY